MYDPQSSANNLANQRIASDSVIFLIPASFERIIQSSLHRRLRQTSIKSSGSRIGLARRSTQADNSKWSPQLQSTAHGSTSLAEKEKCPYSRTGVMAVKCRIYTARELEISRIIGPC